MTREDIKRMALISEVSMYGIGATYQGLDASEGFINRLEHFANLIAKQERKDCAKRLDAVGCEHCSEVIREMGQA
jgi:hypothetical protein